MLNESENKMALSIFAQIQLPRIFSYSAAQGQFSITVWTVFLKCQVWKKTVPHCHCVFLPPPRALLLVIARCVCSPSPAMLPLSALLGARRLGVIVDAFIANCHALLPPISCRLPNVKRGLINYPHLSDYGQRIFCLSFPLRDRSTAPGRYEQFYFTENVPYPQNIYISRAQSDQTRSGTTILQLLLCTALDGRGWLPIYFNALCTAKRVHFITGGYSPIPKDALFLCLSNLHRSAPWIFTNILMIQLYYSLPQLLSTHLKWRTTSLESRHLLGE